MRPRPHPVGSSPGPGATLPVAIGPRLPRSFYDRPASAVARALLGTIVVHRRTDGVRVARVVETEAYERGDPASHAFRGETRRNRTMFGAPGHLYVYPIHQVVCANAVARSREAVLLRAAEPIHGVAGMLDGPGRLCRGLGIHRLLDGADLTRSAVGIFSGSGHRGTIAIGPRIGIRVATRRRLRFALSESPAVSRPRPPGWTGRPTPYFSFAQS